MKITLDSQFGTVTFEEKDKNTSKLLSKKEFLKLMKIITRFKGKKE